MSEDIQQMLVPVDYDINEDTPRGYATNLVVQHTEHEFIVSFFNIEPPLVLGTPEEKQEQLAAIENVHAKCIARITINAGRMEEFIKALNENLGVFKSKFYDIESEE